MLRSSLLAVHWHDELNTSP